MLEVGKNKPLKMGKFIPALTFTTTGYTQGSLAITLTLRITPFWLLKLQR